MEDIIIVNQVKYVYWDMLRMLIPLEKMWIAIFSCFYFKRYYFMQEVHAPILGLWGVKMVVVSVFLAFTVASIVSHDF